MDSFFSPEYPIRKVHLQAFNALFVILNIVWALFIFVQASNISPLTPTQSVCSVTTYGINQVVQLIWNILYPGLIDEELKDSLAIALYITGGVIIFSSLVGLIFSIKRWRIVGVFWIITLFLEYLIFTISSVTKLTCICSHYAKKDMEFDDLLSPEVFKSPAFTIDTDIKNPIFRDQHILEDFIEFLGTHDAIENRVLSHSCSARILQFLIVSGLWSFIFFWPIWFAISSIYHETGTILKCETLLSPVASRKRGAIIYKGKKVYTYD